MNRILAWSLGPLLALSSLSPVQASKYSSKKKQEQKLGVLMLAQRKDPTIGLQTEIAGLESKLETVRRRIAPLAKAANELGNKRWGLLLHTGTDASLLAGDYGDWADIITSKVSNLLADGPFAIYYADPAVLFHDR